MLRHVLALLLAAASAEIVDENGVQWGVTRTYAETKAKDCLASLRATAWHARTEKALQGHPFVKAAERGKLPLLALQRFAGEQRHIQARDAASFAALAGNAWRPTEAGLLDLWRNEAPDLKGLFGTLLGGELAAAPLLQRLILATGLDHDAQGRSEDGSFFAPDPRAQAYGAYWALLARDNSTAAAAAAAAVNFPAWGALCKRVLEGLRKDTKMAAALKQRGLADYEEGLAFLAFFAEPLPKLEEMALALIADTFEQRNGACELLQDDVRTLQAYEVDFWDSVWAWRPARGGARGEL